MREIKFRAWDKEDKKMLYGIEREYDYKLGEGDCFGDFLDNKEWYVVMQFTDLKDKNGKEIYEGDIVKQHFYNSMWFDVIDKVEIDSLFGVNLRTGIKDCEWEIIGNIYENPKLLKDK